MHEPYKVELSWRPKRGGVTGSKRYKYAKTKRDAIRIAKRVIVRSDSRLKTFTVTVIHRRYGSHIDQWAKSNGQIARTK